MNKLLIVIDPQNDFISGKLGTLQAEAAVNTLYKIIHKYGKEKHRIICTKDIHYYNYNKTLEGKRIPDHCLSNSPGSKIDSRIWQALNCYDFIPVTKSKFATLDLVREISKVINQECLIDEIVITGFCTDICVLANATLIRSLLPNIKIKVIENACSGTTIENHKQALNLMSGMLIDIVTAEHVKI